ncbi:MAG TPA: DinB family protein [Candidatus Deferrimicrobium sp.]|nr:DinB family protein [Candidatus Deferrimicrobium sp.]
MTRSLLADAFGHHVWATLQVLDVCAGLTGEQLATTVPGTYGSILDTMRHLVGADRSYLYVCSGGALPEIEEDSMDIAQLRTAMEPTGEGWAALLAADPDPEVTVTRHRDDGTRSHAPMGVRLAQAIHHGTDHRSQVCTALTALGMTPPEIDVWDFARSEGRLSED